MSHSLVARVRARCRLGSETGFTLVEVMVAAGILLTALVAMAYTVTVALSYTAFSRQRQGATGLANQTMEQVRALPFSRLESGLDNTDLTNSASGGSASFDPNITTTGCGGTTPKYCYGGEPIPHGNIVGTGQPACTSTTLPHPLVPHGCPWTVGPTGYTVRVYVTNYIPPGGTLDLASHAYRVTVEVSWSQPQVKGASSKVTTQSVFYSSSGCLSSGTHPFAAPCQPFFYATGDVQPGTVQVSGTIGCNSEPCSDSTVLDPGGTLSPLQFSSGLQVEQITAVQGSSKTSAASGETGGVSAGSVGPINITSGADTDPAQPGHDYDSKTSTAGLTGGPLSLIGDGGSVSLSASGTDSLTTTSTISASVSPSHLCPNLSGTNQTDGQPCGNSKVTPGVAVAAALTLSSTGVSYGPVDVASVAAASGSDVAYTKRVVNTSGACTGDGCVHAEASRVIGTVTLAKLPTGVSPTGAPAGSWLGYLIQITSFTDHTMAEAGIGFAAPTATSSGTIKYWTGAGYATCTISSNCPATIVTTTVTATSGGATVTIPSATLAVGVPSTATTASDCVSPCVTRIAASPSPLVGDISYLVCPVASTPCDEADLANASLANLTIHVNLGELDAKATYKPVTAN